VQSILEGSVRRAGNRVRISVQLVSAANGLHLWSERYDRELADVFAMQDEIAQAIARALETELGARSESSPSGDITARDRPSPARAPVNPAAYDLYLRGRFLFEQHSPLDAVVCCERAVAIDPDFALAHTMYAWSNILAANLNMLPPLTAYPRARAASRRALAIEPDLPGALLADGFIAWWFDWDAAHAQTLVTRLLTLAPELPNAHELHAWTLLSAERFDEAVEAIEHAYAIDPLSDFMLYNLGLLLHVAGRPKRVIELHRRGLVRSPGDGMLHLQLGTALLDVGELLEARATLERGRELAKNTQLGASLVCVLAALGETAVARDRLRELEEETEAGRGSAIEVACGYTALGEDERAYDWLERAFQARSLWMTFLHLEPRLRRLRGTSRFEELVKRVGVAPSRDATADS
jgi:serine/threonine-protein kinase